MKVITTISLLFLCMACEQGTSDFINNLNVGPRINFADGAEVPILTDSIKVSFGLKSEAAYYTVNLTVTDDNSNLDRIEYSQLEGLGTLLQNGDTIFERNISLQGDVLEFQYYPRGFGNHIFSLEAVDQFNESNSVRVNLVAFENLRPIANFNIRRIGQLSRYQYRIDASESYDRDSRFGGAIAEYEYSLVGKIFNVLTPEFNNIFPGFGIYPIQVRVKDNSGSWSEPVEQTLTIN